MAVFVRVLGGRVNSCTVGTSPASGPEPDLSLICHSLLGAGSVCVCMLLLRGAGGRKWLGECWLGLDTANMHNRRVFQALTCRMV
jgi:hypothetical protein